MNDKASILIVDDEEVVRRSHLRSLAGTGCHAEAASDGQEALTVMEQHPFDVVLLDLRMPGLDGLEVLRTLILAHTTTSPSRSDRPKSSGPPTKPGRKSAGRCTEIRMTSRRMASTGASPEAGGSPIE
jgi:hypothetical protein